MTTDSNFALELLRDSVRRFVRAHYTVEQRRALRTASGPTSWAPHWQVFADNGWLGAAFGDAYGGSGGGIAELAALSEELGRGLVIEPYLPNLLAGWLLDTLGTPTQQTQYLGPLVDGSRRMALVWNPAQAVSAITDGHVRIQASPDGLVLNGQQAVVAGADADVLLVIALLGDPCDDKHLACVLVPANTLGVHRHIYRTVNDSGAADLVFEQVQLPIEAMLGQAGHCAPALNQLFDLAATLTCCETVGAIALAFDTTLVYLKQRTQFGRPLGQNQALQHRMVDLQILLRECEALTQQALHALGGTDTKARALAVSAAKAHVNKAARRMGQEAIQMHGGIGTTDEALISHAFKHLMALRAQCGDTPWHQQRVAQCLDYLPCPVHASPKGQP